MSPVMVVSYPEDVHGTVLETLLRQRDVEVARLSLDEVAERFTWQLGTGLSLDQSRVDRGRWSGIWRRLGVPALDAIDPAYGDFAMSETRDAFRGALMSLGIDWLNEPDALWRAEHKLVQLEAARGLGLRVPHTVVTNDPAVAKQFTDGRETVAKAVRYGLVATAPEPRMAWTQRVEPQAEFVFGGVPVVFQEAITARAHLRVVTVECRVFASRLVSDALDWRATDGAVGEWIQLSASEVPAGLEQDAVRLARALQLNYTSQDWLVDDDARPIFLEANPNGQWLFLDEGGPDRPRQQPTGRRQEDSVLCRQRRPPNLTAQDG